MYLFDEFLCYLDDDSEEPEYYQCHVCGKKIIENNWKTGEYRICEYSSRNGCQIKLREVVTLSREMHKSIILRHNECYIQKYKIGKFLVKIL